jgi:threonine aldolase
MRQAGILAAAGLYALEHNVDRLAEDHGRARALAEFLAGLPGLRVDLEETQTNIIAVELDSAPLAAEDIQRGMAERGVLLLTMGPDRLRLLTHLDVNDEDIRVAMDAFQDLWQTC